MSKFQVIIAGGGFTGLAAAYSLTKRGIKVLVLEKENVPGGLAAGFFFQDDVSVERFYHHWFVSDVHVTGLLKKLNLDSEIKTQISTTGMYFNHNIWRLSKPLDLLKFRVLSFWARIRLGLLVFRVRSFKDWKQIEHLSIREWLEPLCGKEVFRVVWAPLVEAKFSEFAEHVSAVWMWKKLVLRGGTRDKQGREQLLYFQGGFDRLAKILCEEITKNGGKIIFESNIERVTVVDGELTKVLTNKDEYSADEFLFTQSTHIVADIFKGSAPNDWLKKLYRINYLGNICLVLKLSKSLSNTYWLNVNDPGFQFVGVIEHTNLDGPENYGGFHIIYLSRYLSWSCEDWGLSDKEYLNFALPHLMKMFPHFDETWVLDYKVWRAQYAQPVTEKNYSHIIPPVNTPFRNCNLVTMAQIYPEDRGTNYAIRDGLQIANKLAEKLTKTERSS